jgi:hypothetical protein
MADIIGHFVQEAMRAFLSVTLWAANSAGSVVNMTDDVLLGTGSLIMDAAAMTSVWAWSIFGCVAFRNLEK